MAVERVIGVDFGTSTSIVKTKRFEVYEVNGSKVFNPVGDKYHTNSVTFSSDPRALSFVRINEDGTVDCGIDEEIPGSKLFREFKMNLESDSVEESEKSKELTHEYMKYLFERYSHQAEEGVHGEKDDEISTIISFPVKWKDETRKFMLRAAKEAGFENVTAMDEASAALYAVLCRNMDNIKDKNLLNKNKENTILIIDMGAGTTDLAVCRCTVDSDGNKVKAENIKNELVFSWPDSSVKLTFGGREIDEKLKEFLLDYLVKCNLPQEAGRNYLEQNRGVKSWKEETLSPSLRKGISVKNCPLVDGLMFFPGIKKEPFPEITRESFEKTIEDKIEDFKTLVNGCLDKLDENCAVDIVILTGGHSNWYFAKELIDGTMPGLEHPALSKVQAEKGRVMNLENPQETVALGMVYSKLPFDVIGKTVVEERYEDRNVYQKDYADENYQEMHDVSDAAVNNKYNVNDVLTSALSSYPLPPSAEALRKTLKISENKTIFFARDISPESDGSAGTIICEDGIFSTSNSDCYIAKISWKSFVAGNLIRQDYSIVCNNGYLSNRVHGNSDQDVFEIFVNLQKKLIEEKVVALDEKKKATATESDSSDKIANYEPVAVRAKAYIEANIGLISKSISGNASGLKRHLNVLDGEKFYFWKDTTIFESGKNGWVMTDKAFYCRTFWEYPIRFDWESFGNFVSVTYLETDNKIQLNFKGGRYYTIYCSGYFKDFQKFFVGLYKSLSNR